MSLEKIIELRMMIDSLEQELDKIDTFSMDVKDFCTLLVELNYAKRDLGYAYGRLENLVSKAMDSTENIALDNGATIEKKFSYDRKGWNHKSLASAVAQKIVQMSIDMDTGEVIKTPEQIAEEMLTYCAPSYWRIKELGKLGIVADRYCEVGELKASIIVRKPKD